jgi:DNA-binding CsgD family transcriptional regulator
MAILNIKENTLKFHNKNIYGKLGVSSRKQLLEIHKQIKLEQ